MSAAPARLDARAAAWTVVAAAFTAPLNEATVAALRDPHQLATWPLRGEYFEAACAQFGESAARADGAENLEALRIAHQTMFTGPGRVDPSPWESVHRSREGLVFDEQTSQVRAAYREFGLQSARLHKNPEDHVAIEAEFLAYLLTSALDRLDDGGDAGRYLDGYTRFLAEHAGHWLPAYFEAFATAAATHYHRGIALLGAQTVADAAW